MKIALAQLNFHIGNFESNTQKIIEAAHQAASNGAELTVFAELAVSGYPPRDFLEFDDFIHRCELEVDRIAEACSDIPIILGTPVRNSSPKGKPLYNAAVFIHHRKKQYFRKALLPNYDVFDEYRYFESASSFECLEFNGRTIAVTVCEDLWNLGENPLYVRQPMEELIKQKPDLMINIAASPFDYKRALERESVLRSNVTKYKLPLVYVNHVGAQTELLFDGGSLVMNRDGELVERLPFFEEKLQIVTVDDTVKAKKEFLIPEKIALIHDALVMGIRNYFEKLGFQKAILGLSGGIDSAVTMALAAEALGAENVFALLMPSQFSSDHSVSDALQLAEKLGSPNETIPIAALFDAYEKQLAAVFKGRAFDVTEENIQARTRGVLLMALSNKFGYILLNTSNKSESAVGYGTLYGDMNGGISVLGDLYKTEVFELARYINSNKEIIPLNSIVKPPSAELRPDQKDSDSLPDYEILDKILYAYIEERQGPEAIIAAGFDEKTVARVLRMVNQNEHKRHQTPPILRVSSKAFGMGRRMPIVAKYLI
ncbi:MAG: NAD+ synthase [Bacteroidetes bacterium]|nr:NAD+ synthase [Bacteroidota bacterium]MBU1580066.1 NAD+ synthase [Bacteroidota bacterium]MBU2558326.1 NAD+ synthase [Bacteroidota bacterium]